MYRNCGRLFSALKDSKYIKLPSSKVQNCTNISHTFGNRLFSASMPLANKKVAVILSGSGVYDGTEIHEAAACFAALSRHGAIPVAYTLDKDQHHVVAHNSGQEQEQKRNVMVESSRIARGAVENVASLTADSNIDALVFPGGFGAAKNLSDFAFKGTEMTVDPEIERILKEFKASGKPIALCCIAPILAAKVLGTEGVKLTMGKKGDENEWPYGGAIDAARSFGATLVESDVSEVVIDDENKIVTTPAYMYNGKFHEIQDGVSKMIAELVKM